VWFCSILVYCRAPLQPISEYTSTSSMLTSMPSSKTIKEPAEPSRAGLYAMAQDGPLYTSGQQWRLTQCAQASSCRAKRVWFVSRRAVGLRQPESQRLPSSDSANRKPTARIIRLSHQLFDRQSDCPRLFPAGSQAVLANAATAKRGQTQSLLSAAALTATHCGLSLERHRIACLTYTGQACQATH
jgi:hypothetical protein